MLDIKFIRENPKKVKEGLKKKGVDFDLDKLLEIDELRRAKIKEIDDLRAEHNQLSEGISKTINQKEKNSDKDLLRLGTLKHQIKESKNLVSRLDGIESEMRALDEKFHSLMYKLPNLPDNDVPIGKNESDNKILREMEEKPKFDFKPRDYIELGGKLDLIDTERAAKVSGARFGYLKHEAPLLEFALVQFAFDFVRDEENIKNIIKEKGLSINSKAFIPVIPPVLIKPEAMKAMGYVERGGDEIYFLEKDNLYLVGTSEQAVGPMHMNEIFEEEKLPHRHIAFSTCFRREAGSYGKDTKGIIRVHQFDKVEMFVFSMPETSKDEHKLLLGIEERLMQKLNLSYRVLNICSGDLGDPAAAKYDIEAWLPGQNDGKGEYRETHSTSNTTDFQSRRLNIKYRSNANGQMSKVGYVHMLNGTALAIGRTIIAILENYQQKDGSVKIPEVLQKYTGFKEIKNKVPA